MLKKDIVLEFWLYTEGGVAMTPPSVIISSHAFAPRSLQSCSSNRLSHTFAHIHPIIYGCILMMYMHQIPGNNDDESYFRGMGSSVATTGTVHTRRCREPEIQKPFIWREPRELQAVREPVRELWSAQEPA